jgi:hypothetical protein
MARGGGAGWQGGGAGWQGGGGGSGGQGRGGSGGGGAGGSRGASRAQVVFVKTAKGIEPRLVRLGLSDFDWSQVVAGVSEGEQVVMLGVAQAQASRTEQQQNVRQRVGGMPGGIGGAGAGGGGRGSGGGGRQGGS